MDGPLELPDSLTEGDPRLRLPTGRDIPRIVEVCRDPDVARFTNVPVPYGDDDARYFVDTAAASREDGTSVHLVAVDPDDRVLGAVGMGISWADRVGAAGYWVAPDARGRGVASGATRRLCRWAFDELRLMRIELHAAASNEASNAVARTLGFTHEGTHRSAMVLAAVGGLEERRDDENVWGLLPGELR